MKRAFIGISILMVSAMAVCAQGRVLFNNTSSVNPIYVGPPTPPLVFAGANYSIQLLWAPGTFADQTAFDAANPSASASFAFFGTTGSAPAHGPPADGAGLFDGGVVAMGGPAGIYTMQARGWFNNGQFLTYVAAQSAGVNYGVSPLFTVNVTAPEDAAPSTSFPSFQIWTIPEPFTLTLVALGTVGLLLFRRRK